MEDMIIAVKENTTFKSSELNRATQKIITIGKRMQKNMYEVADVLAKVDQSKAYEQDGFKSTAEYAMKTFGFKKTQAYTLLSIGKEWTSPKLESTLPHIDGKDFTITQVEKLSALGSKEEVIKAVESGEVTPDMTVSQIREYVKVKKGNVLEEENDNITKDKAVKIIEHIDDITTNLRDMVSVLGNTKDGNKVESFIKFSEKLKQKCYDLVNEVEEINQDIK